MKEIYSGSKLIDHIADEIRKRIIEGVYRPGEHLSEIYLRENLEVSRNTLREVFRLLTIEGLLDYQPNRGVFVSVPNLATILDVYRVRRFLELQAIKDAQPYHPAVAKMRYFVEQQIQFREKGDWLNSGNADVRFHSSIVALADSPRLSMFFDHVAVQLRLIIGLLDEEQYLHAPYVLKNDEITTLLESGRVQDAENLLRLYLIKSEHFILNIYSKRSDN